MKKFFVGLLVSVTLAIPAVAADLGGRVLSIGSDTTYPPHEFIEDGVVKGFDVDVVAAICEKINCQPNWVTTAWDGIFAALADGQFDMVVSGVTITDERDKTIASIGHKITIFFAGAGFITLLVGLNFGYEIIDLSLIHI